MRLARLDDWANSWHCAELHAVARGRGAPDAAMCAALAIEQFAVRSFPFGNALAASLRKAHSAICGGA
eukprot:12961359-Alexandrium_andersonii.AAC.1